MKAYTLKKKNKTAEYHLFEGDFITNSTKCNTHLIKKSICGKMDISESEINIFGCRNENEARVKIARHGRQVCGVCASHLYTTY